MLQLIVSSKELFNDAAQTFIVIPEQTICLEHSLISISRWESRWEKPYISKQPKNNDEILSYISCMSMNKEIPLEVILCLSGDQLTEIQKYIDASMTATTFPKDNSPPSKRIVTAEVIYGQMVGLNIPFSCDKWHFNRLMTLIRVCSLQNQPQKKMSKRDLNNRNRQLNQERRARHNTGG